MLIYKKFALLLFLLISSVTLFSQKTLKKGHIRYELKEVRLAEQNLDNTDFSAGDIVSFLEGSTIDMYFNKNSRRLDVEVPGIVRLQLIQDDKSEKVAQLIDLFGQKMRSDIDVSKENQNWLDKFQLPSDLDYDGKDIRIIVGQACQKLEMNLGEMNQGQNARAEIWTSMKYKMPEIEYFPLDLNKFEGIPLAMKFYAGNDIIVLEAVEFQKSVKKNVFDIPSGYKNAENADFGEILENFKM